MPTTETPKPFATDAEYLDAEFAWLHAKSQRLDAVARERDARRDEETNDARAHRPGRMASEDARKNAERFGAEETRLRQEIDARLAVHRATKDAPKLGLDKLCEEADLNAAERTVLLAAAVPGFSQPFAERIFADTGFYGALSVADLSLLLEPVGTADWLAARRLFRLDAPLRGHGLVMLGDLKGDCGPDALPNVDVRLSMQAWATLIGDEDATDELGIDPFDDL